MLVAKRLAPSLQRLMIELFGIRKTALVMGKKCQCVDDRHGVWMLVAQRLAPSLDRLSTKSGVYR